MPPMTRNDAAKKGGKGGEKGSNSNKGKKRNSTPTPQPQSSGSAATSTTSQTNGEQQLQQVKYAYDVYLNHYNTHGRCMFAITFIGTSYSPYHPSEQPVSE